MLSDPSLPTTTLPGEPPPPDDDPGPSRLDPRVVRVWRLGSAISAAVATVVAALVCAIVEASFLWTLPVLALGVAEGVLHPRAAYRGWSYTVGEEEVRLRRGVWWRRESVVPLSRIQPVDTQQGPVERAFGLATLVLFTAGSVGARLVIPGLAAAHAEALRDRLAALGGREDAV